MKFIPYSFFLCVTVLVALSGWTTLNPGRQQISNTTYPYLNARLPIDQRVQDLLSRMTLNEKVGQMCQYVGIEHMKATVKVMNKPGAVNKDAYSIYPGYSPDDIKAMIKKGVIGSFLHVVTAKEANELQALAQQSRLKIPLLIGIDAIHGDGMVAGTTIFPSPIGLASTWDTALVRNVSYYTAVEMRATGSQWAFSPNLDVARDARWGRVGETYGEDPYLVTQMGLAVINGLQGNLNGPNNVLACAKHLIAGSESVNGLNVAPTDISERTLEEIFLPPYQAAVKANVATVMPAHNEINGQPCHANKALMTDLLRKQWGFSGFYISDFMDIERLALVHQTATSQEEAVYQTLDAGMDMHMHGPNFLEPVMKLIASDSVTEARINESVSRILKAKFQLGLFESPYVNEKAIDKNVFTSEHQSAALEAARKSIVLLKNNRLLPLTNQYKKILVVGPNSNNQAQLGDWSLQQPADHIITMLQGIRQEAPQSSQVSYVDVGGSTLKISESKIDSANLKAKEADVTVVVIGENALRFAGRDRTSGENVDRDNVDLLGEQLKLVQRIVATGKPVVVVLINGRPLSIPWIDAHVPAIIEAWEPGQAGGKAVAEVLFGKINPSGKLPISFPRSVGQIPVYYNHKPSQYVRQYVGVANTPLYEFGYGLSYTSFSVENLEVNAATIKPGQSITVSTDLCNTGAIAGDEVLQAYIHCPSDGITRPVKELKAFSRQHLTPGEKRTVSFTLTPDLLACINNRMQKEVLKGTYTVMLGTSARDADLKAVKFKVI